MCVCVWGGGGGGEGVLYVFFITDDLQCCSVCIKVFLVECLDSTVLLHTGHTASSSSYGGGLEPSLHHFDHPFTPPQVVKKNGDEREEALNTPMDGYELFMQFIVRQYRRGLRVRGRRGGRRWREEEEEGGGRRKREKGEGGRRGKGERGR